MEKMSDKIFAQSFSLIRRNVLDIYNLLDKETTAKLSTYSKEADII